MDCRTIGDSPMTAELSAELLDSVRSARACMADIRALAGKLGDLTQGQIEATLQGFLNTGEDRALSRLLQVCAFNEVKLDPKVLCGCIGVCEDLLDSAPCFALQDEHVIEPLLEAATAEALPFERQSYAAALAAELTIKLGLDPQPVRKVLWKLEHTTRAPEAQLLLAQSLRLLDEGQDPEQGPVPLWSAFQLSDLLPEHRPRTVVGGTYTVRRPVAKLGRNDPCHCGSGKKYKKCCYAKDQELLRDASQYEGTTRTDLKAKPGLVDDPNVVLDMRAHELKQLSPSALSDGQLHSGYQRALAFGMRELAFEMLCESQRRATEEAFDPGHFEDLIEDVLQAGDLDLARRIQDHCGEQAWWRPQAIAFRFDLLEHPERFEPLERDCRKAVREVSDEEAEFDEPLTRLAYDFAPRHPALAIAFARAAIASHPDRLFDNEMLLEVIRDARVDLDLAPDGDPVEALFDWIEDRGRHKKKAQAENEDMVRLADQLDATLAALNEKKRALRETEDALAAVGAELEKARGAVVEDPHEPHASATFGAGKEATLRRLRGQVEGLKAEIGAQQAERRQLRKLLGDERKKLAALSESSTLATSPSAAEEAVVVEPAGRPLLPEYSDAFRKRLASLAPPLAAKAILAAGRFASHEAAIWRHTKPLERLPEHYRIRLGLDYRLIVHWQPGKVLEIVDLISRQDLESWIRRQG
jgi:hypothetical protein